MGHRRRTHITNGVDAMTTSLPQRLASNVRTWPGSPVKEQARTVPDSELPRYTLVEHSARAIGFREGERKGLRFGYYWGLASGMIIGSAVTAAAMVAWVVYRHPTT
jgi:hypothetical protein